MSALVIYVIESCLNDSGQIVWVVSRKIVRRNQVLYGAEVSV